MVAGGGGVRGGLGDYMADAAGLETGGAVEAFEGVCR